MGLHAQFDHGECNLPNTDVRTYRLGLLRAAGVFGFVVAVLSVGAAFRISDWPMMTASLLVGILALLVFVMCSRKLQPKSS